VDHELARALAACTGSGIYRSWIGVRWFGRLRGPCCWGGPARRPQWTCAWS